MILKISFWAKKKIQLNLPVVVDSKVKVVDAVTVDEETVDVLMVDAVMVAVLTVEDGVELCITVIIVIPFELPVWVVKVVVFEVVSVAEVQWEK